jgi:hypothetical protein
MTEKPKTEDQAPSIEELKKLQPGLSMRDYKSALRDTKSITEAAEWLRVKRQCYI